MEKIIIYTAGLLGKTGIYTWIRNFCINMRKDFAIAIMCQTFENSILEDLMQYAVCDIYDKDRQYECDIYLHNYQDNDFKANINAERRFIVLHCDYAKYGHSGAFEGHTKYITVSEDSAQGMKAVYGIDCTAIEPFLAEHKPKRVYRFVSATRIHRTKGWDRMMQFCQMLTERDIRFQWLLFTDGKVKPMPYVGFLNMGAQPNEIVRDYMADADYVVQLSDHEGFCYSVHEALSVGTPCLVTDIPVFRNVVINGYNGYRLPLDMDNIPLDAILNCVPTDFNYRLKNDEIRQQWLARFKDG